MREGERSDLQRVDKQRRVLDLVVGSVAVVLAVPVIVLVATGSAIALRAWPFFIQDRVGRNGELFRFVKVRTLPVAVPSYIDKHQLDTRQIPAFCRLLRRLHLDELPQLFLVLSGRMSLVGPRPEMAYLHEQMPRGFQRHRTSIRPGCTGLWQVSTSCADLIGVSPEYDRYYLAHRSVRLDTWVLVRTMGKMVGKRRSVTFDDLPSWAGKPVPADGGLAAEPAYQGAVGR